MHERQRQPDRLPEQMRPVLQVHVQVRLRRVARVPAHPQHLSLPHPLTRTDPDAPPPQVRQQRILAVSEVQDHMVTRRLCRVHHPRRVVGDAVHRLGDHGLRRRDHVPAPSPIVGIVRPRPSVRPALPPDTEVIRMALVRRDHVVVLHPRVSAPEDPPLPVEGQPDRRLRPVACPRVRRQNRPRRQKQPRHLARRVERHQDAQHPPRPRRMVGLVDGRVRSDEERRLALACPQGPRPCQRLCQLRFRHGLCHRLIEPLEQHGGIPPDDQRID